MGLNTLCNMVQLKAAIIRKKPDLSNQTTNLVNSKIQKDNNSLYNVIQAVLGGLQYVLTHIDNKVDSTVTDAITTSSLITGNNQQVDYPNSDYLANIHQRGLRVDQPNAAKVFTGTLYFVTDETKLERSNGVTWDSYS